MDSIFLVILIKQDVDLPTRYRITQVILMKQEVDLTTRYRITHVILMKQRGRFTY